MWLTGFDAPSCSTLDLDKPMRGHTLMQTIARANRVYGDKVNGLIADYANVFQEQEKALAIYGSGTGGGEMPVKDKKELVEALRIALNQVSGVGPRSRTNPRFRGRSPQQNKCAIFDGKMLHCGDRPEWR
jgi:type I site-specific restriction-modification system R (restriction) subunit